MSVAELTSVVPPPARPIETGSPELRQSIEDSIGLRLPQDFIDLATTYGSGMFSDGQFWFLNPFAPWYRNDVDRTCSIFLKLKATEGDDFIPYDIYPTQPGLFPWGAETNGNSMFWLTTGESDSWPIVLYDRDMGEFEELRMPVSTFLSKLFTCELKCSLCAEDTQQRLCREYEVHGG